MYRCILFAHPLLSPLFADFFFFLFCERVEFGIWDVSEKDGHILNCGNSRSIIVPLQMHTHTHTHARVQFALLCVCVWTKCNNNKNAQLKLLTKVRPFFWPDLDSGLERETHTHTRTQKTNENNNKTTTHPNSNLFHCFPLIINLYFVWRFLNAFELHFGFDIKSLRAAQ